MFSDNYKSFYSVYQVDKIKNEIDFIKERDRTLFTLLEDITINNVGLRGLDERLDAWIKAWEEVDDDKYEKHVNKDELNSYINTFLGKLVSMQVGLKDSLIIEASKEIKHLKKIICEFSETDIINEKED